MTLDDDHTWKEQARRDEAYYDEVLRLEWLDREACESIEAMEAHWAGVFAKDPHPDVWYDRPAFLDRAQRGPHDG